MAKRRQHDNLTFPPFIVINAAKAPVAAASSKHDCDIESDSDGVCKARLMSGAETIGIIVGGAEEQ
jgi:hypothetical protein